ncbi:MAG: hypothetical protein GOU99_00870 [Candidatus Altiarchaeota archaeon]|nr:hypothetical protein [Candidatus Altiarchaeota archaeon]
MSEKTEIPIMALLRLLIAFATIIVIFRSLGSGFMSGLASLAATQLKTKVTAMASSVGEMIGARI